MNFWNSVKCGRWRNKWRLLAVIIAIICLIYLYSVFIEYQEPVLEELPDHVFNNLSWIETNPIFSRFNISTPSVRKKVTVLIIISSAPQRYDRRQAIRETWWQDCRPTKKVVPECIFMTDKQDPSSQYYQQILSESQQYGDVRVQSLKGGVELGKRYLLHAIFAVKHYDFDYFVRMDDDQFLCLNNFLQELPQPMRPNFHWGWVHCIYQIVRPEESIILFSKDLLLRFLYQDPRSMKCHVMADQMIGAWTMDLNLGGIFRHDDRIHHVPIVSKIPELREQVDICKHYIAIHGTYADDMRHFWKVRGPALKVTSDLFSNSRKCRYKKYDWKQFLDRFRFEPKNCIENPKWDTQKVFPNGGIYLGRESS